MYFVFGPFSAHIDSYVEDTSDLNCYVRTSVGLRSFTTKTLHQSGRNPIWYETFITTLTPGDIIKFEILDENDQRSDLLGTVEARFEDIEKMGGTLAKALTFRTQKCSGSLDFKISDNLARAGYSAPNQSQGLSSRRSGYLKKSISPPQVNQQCGPNTQTSFVSSVQANQNFSPQNSANGSAFSVSQISHVTSNSNLIHTNSCNLPPTHGSNSYSAITQSSLYGPVCTPQVYRPEEEPINFEIFCKR